MDPNTIATNLLFKLLEYLNIFRWFKVIKLNLLPPNFNVGISIDDSNSETSKTYHKELVRYLFEIIDQHNLLGQIKINDFSNLKTFNNKEQAEGFRNGKSLDLLIWGDFSPDTLKIEGKSVVQPRLNFTFGHPLDAQNKLKDILLLEIGSLDKARSIGRIIKSDESFTEVRKLPLDVFELSIYIIALSLKLFGKFDKSILLFESLLSSSNNTDNSIQGVRLHLINLYILKLQLYNWVNASHSESDQALGIATKLLNLDVNNLIGLVSKAYHEFRLGQLDLSEYTIKSLQLSYPMSHFTWIDIAFISIVQKNYKRAYDYYDRLAFVENPQFDVIQVIDFLDSQYDSNRKEVAFMFASGYLNVLYADKSRGRKLLKRFINRANDGTYKFMYRRAKRILRNG